MAGIDKIYANKKQYLFLMEFLKNNYPLSTLNISSYDNIESNWGGKEEREVPIYNMSTRSDLILYRKSVGVIGLEFIIDRINDMFSIKKQYNKRKSYDISMRRRHFRKIIKKSLMEWVRYYRDQIKKFPFESGYLKKRLREQRMIDRFDMRSQYHYRM